ncbi:elongation factor 4 [bacterium Unc6]|nr:elongation factor 4 [bacterium Unc6]
MEQNLIRNFCIIAHIDHGKSTLADRLLQATGAVGEREFKNQILDDMELERERGITIKASAVRINYRADDGNVYTLNLIDTPGHVDFSYEVSKALASCEGAILVVDASQGIEAQTVANFNLARGQGLKIIPVINKIDLPNVDTENVRQELFNVLHIEDEPIYASAKTGAGIKEILERIIKDIPPSSGNPDELLQALIFDSKYDVHRGVIIYVRVFNGRLKSRQKIRLVATGNSYETIEVGVFVPKPQKVETLSTGEVGYIIANIKDATLVRTGDTVTDDKNPCITPLPGYEPLKPLVFCGIYPVNNKDFEMLKEAMFKLHLTDASFTFEPEKSSSIGVGFRCGFMGLLHMDIIQERLEREFGLNIVATTPSVAYRVLTTDGNIIEVDSPSKFPSAQKIKKIQEPMILALLIVPSESIGPLMQEAIERRGVLHLSEYIKSDTVMLRFEFPLSEVIVDFYNRLKSITRGYGSMDYERTGYRDANLVKLDILVQGEILEPLSTIIVCERAYQRGKKLIEKLKEQIPRHLFEIPLQAAIGGKIIARETIRPLGKNVTAKCYGGDITRKRKLWEKQKEGKKRMKQFGRIQIPQGAFFAVMK